MGSPLDFISTDGFRKKLITRNLTPYGKAPNRPTLPTNYEYIQSDTSVQDSPDQLIDEPSFANKLFPLNQYGNEGGYEQVPDPGGLLNTKSNEGEYGYQDANILGQALPESQRWKPLNVYSNGNQLPFDSAPFFDSLGRPVGTLNYNNQPYGIGSAFVNSSYSPISILLSPDPQGSNGLLSQDSFIAKLGAATLRKEFETRIAAQIKQDTIARANVFNVRSGTDVLSIITNRVPLIEPNYTITVSPNPVLAAANFALRLAGSILPTSTIPGSYFDPSVNSGQPTTIQQLTNAFRGSAVGNVFNRLLGAGQTGSQTFYNYMGGGQKSRLFNNIDYNKYKPSFDRTLFDRLGGAIVGSTTNNSNYYIGSTSSDPSRVFSPGGVLPINQFGQEQQSPVYGPSELAQLYEGPSKDIRLGANGPTYSNGGGIEGGFTWVSPKYKGNAGKKVGLGGLIANEDEDFKPSSYNTTESTERTFKQGSILDQTQRIINSQPQGGKRLQHVGNAIDQVSKVFNDGYKELTKGSRVLSYVGAIGQEVGSEYCRVFAKDIPYLQYNDLQKQDGITTEGRRFSYSVLDKAYNLNITPNKQEGGQDSTNIIGGTNNAYAKKYMFSIENLAWRTSNAPGFSVADLAVCERGPNGGRVMWFPPYGLTFTESSTANWKANDFLGRPEPVYTYNNTSRTGSLTWKIVVDHPSVLNLIVNKVLSNETNKVRVDSIIESFFAGCRKYDIYELAKKYYMINPNDLFVLQQAITSKELTREQLEFTKQTIQTGDKSPNGYDVPLAGNGSSTQFESYTNIGFYFDNDIPAPSISNPDFNSEYVYYEGRVSGVYKTKSTAQQTSAFFNAVVKPNKDKADELAKAIGKALKENTGTISITLNSSCSAPATQSYNQELSKRRITAALNFFKNNEATKQYYATNRLLILTGSVAGEVATVKQYDDKGNPIAGKTVNCSDTSTTSGGDTQVRADEIFTTNAMACRRTYISDITPKLQSTTPTTPPTPNYVDTVVGNVVTETYNQTTIEEKWVNRDNITKRVLRALLSECDYFETIKQDTPMVYDNLKEKLKFFQPAFHSTTPEGLNSRLTFLQQCMRPGDTIPTIAQAGVDTKLQYNNATNTAFGAPPVLVLRIGDFYNTKIIPDNLSLTYENLDLNPEGIGIQPMIANVTLSFKFVGGSGLKESVDKLQNALTFNYYANTEIWDDRADTTDESYKVIDKEFLVGIGSPQPPALNQAAPNNGQSNASTVGKVISTVIGDQFTTGTLSYSDFMVTMVKDTQNYFTNVINKSKETNSQYNNAVRQQWMLNRNYTQGNLNVGTDPVVLFGKPANVEKNFDTIFGQLESDIKSGDEQFIKFISEPSKDFSAKLIRTVKDNYFNFVKNKRSSFQTAVSKIIQDITTVEQTYINNLGRANTIVFPGIPLTGTDGYQQQNGKVITYVTLGTDKVNISSTNVTNTLQEMVIDLQTIQRDITAFNADIWSPYSFTYKGEQYSGNLVFEVNNLGKSTAVTPEKVFVPFSKNVSFDNPSFKRVYMIVSEDVVDEKKYQTFKTQLIGNIINNQGVIGKGADNIEAVFDTYWQKNTRPVFVTENDITKAFIDDIEKNKLKKYLIYTPFDKKERLFTYTTENGAADNIKDSQQDLIKGLGATTNLNTNINTWNDTVNTVGSYVSKAKLN
jgi:hypothetical protein